MKISEVSKITGLTKKAIRYYECKGLISEDDYDKSGYKDYCEETIEQLHQIAFLRNLDMSVSEISLYLSSDDRDIILRRYLNKIESRVSKLNLIRKTILELMENSIDYTSYNERVTNMERNQNDFVLNKISKLFPTVFGEYIITHFREYLLEPIDTSEKEQAFNEIIDFLDDIDEEPIQVEINDYLNIINKDELTQVNIEIDKKLKTLNIDLNNYEEVRDFKKSIIDTNNRMNEVLVEFPQIKNMQAKLQKHLYDSGYYDKFVNNLRIISPKYDSYINYMEELSNKIKIDDK